MGQELAVSAEELMANQMEELYADGRGHIKALFTAQVVGSLVLRHPSAFDTSFQFLKLL